MTKEAPISPDKVSIEYLRILENNLALQRSLTRTDDETSTSPLHIRRPVYTPPPPKTPWLALAAFGLVATGFFMGIWAALAWAFLL